MYAAESLALATLEKIVAVNDVQRLREMVYVPAHLDEEAVWAPSLADLPDGWDQRPPTAASQDSGTDWLDLERSPALQVPSALFPTEAHNYVLNPAHPEFDAADDLLCVDLGGRRIIKKKKVSWTPYGCSDQRISAPTAAQPQMSDSRPVNVVLLMTLADTASL